LTQFLISGDASKNIRDKKGQIIFVDLSDITKSDEIQWIKNQIRPNREPNARTILISLYDFISTLDLRNNGVKEEDLYFIRMIQGRTPTTAVFNEHVMTINDDISSLNLLIKDIIKFSNEKKVNSQIIIYTFSSLLHVHGWKRVYSFLISNISEIRTSYVNLYVLYYSNTHSNISNLAMFEKIADDVIKLH
jgi:hypothetical protein